MLWNEFDILEMDGGGYVSRVVNRGSDTLEWAAEEKSGTILLCVVETMMWCWCSKVALRWSPNTLQRPLG